PRRGPRPRRTRRQPSPHAGPTPSPHAPAHHGADRDRSARLDREVGTGERRRLGGVWQEARESAELLLELALDLPFLLEQLAELLLGQLELLLRVGGPHFGLLGPAQGHPNVFLAARGGIGPGRRPPLGLPRA